MEPDVFPPAHTPGGIVMPHKPTEQEMENCGYARRKETVCPRKIGRRQPIFGGPAPLIDCASCPYHSHNIPIGG